MLKVFLCQQKAGLDESDIHATGDAIFSRLPGLLGDDVREIPGASEMTLARNTAAWCLGYDITMMSEADAVVFAPGWEQSKDCRIQHHICEEYGIPYMNLTKVSDEYWPLIGSKERTECIRLRN